MAYQGHFHSCIDQTLFTSIYICLNEDPSRLYAVAGRPLVVFLKLLPWSWGLKITNIAEQNVLFACKLNSSFLHDIVGCLFSCKKRSCILKQYGPCCHNGNMIHVLPEGDLLLGWCLLWRWTLIFG